MLNWTENGMGSMTVGQLKDLHRQAEIDGDDLTCSEVIDELKSRTVTVKQPVQSVFSF